MEYGLISLRAKSKKLFIEFPPNLIIVGVMFYKNNTSGQIIFKPLFLKVKWSDFSAIFTRGELDVTRIPFNQHLWT